MHLPKLTILKKLQLTPEGHYRYYSPYTVDRKHKQRPPLLDMAEHKFKTERDLCWFIYQTFGDGEFRFVGHKKGRCGCWTFWKGVINSDGFQFYTKISEEQKRIEKLKDQMKKAGEDEIQWIQDEMDLEKEIKSISGSRYGFIPFLKPSGRRGVFVFWDDIDYVMPQEEIETWNASQLSVYDEDKKASDAEKEKNSFEKWNPDLIKKENAIGDSNFEKW